MSANNTVHVTNISGETDDKEIKDFFSFWSVFPHEVLMYQRTHTNF